MTNKARIAIAVHIYYPELWDEISVYLSNINRPFDLFVTTTNENKLKITSAIQTHFPNAVIKTVANQGMDILPFLSLIPEFVEAKYQAVCKLHTKKGNAELGAIWQQTLLHSLVGSDQTIELVTGAFSGNHQVGIVGTGAFYLSAQKIRQTNNTVFLQQLYQQLKFTSPPNDWGFFAGNMFWVKPEILMPLSLVVNEHPNWFKTSSNSQQDGKIEHALERVIGLIPLQTKQLIGYLLPETGSKQNYALHVVNNVLAQNKIGQVYINPLLQQYQTLEQDRRLLLRTGLFSYSDYLKQFPDLSGIHADLPSHYLLIGRFQGATPHPDFDPIIYRQLHQQQLVNDEDCFLHYVRHGAIKNLLLRKTNEQQQTDIPSFRYQILNTALIDWAAQKRKVRNDDLVSIIIPVFNQGPLTQECIESLYQHTPAERFELVVVDNGSYAETQNILQQLAVKHSNMRIVRNEENLNFALGCNLGFAMSQGSKIIFLNNDTTVTANWLEPLLEPLDRLEISAVQPKLLYPDGTVQCIGITFSDNSPLGYPLYANMEPENSWINISREFPAVTATCMACRAENFLAARGFSTLYINGQEDVDLCLRINDSIGATAWYTSKTTVFHHGSVTSTRSQYTLFNRLKFTEKWKQKNDQRIETLYTADGFVALAWEQDHDTREIAICKPKLQKFKELNIRITTKNIYEYLKNLNSNQTLTKQEQLAKELRVCFLKFVSSYNYLALDVNELTNSFLNKSNMEFLNSAYKLLFGRSPEQHEKNHFIQFSKLVFLETVLSSNECITHQKYLAATQPKKSINKDAWQCKNYLPAAIRLETSLKPLVSVIIPVYGKIDYTLMCLHSIMQNEPTLPYEVIVVDDKSPDATIKKLAKVRGIKVLQNKKNGGFIISCNNGASISQGKYLLFLNNDTEVHNGWMDELYKTFQILPSTGLAGSKLIYPDGALQEAGGIIWRDGSSWNLGNRQNPESPAFNYAREVDYVSGASIMIPKKLFDSLGGFDIHYIPAYCEDSDLALKIRAKGLRVIYQPMSVVTHYEGITSGTDTKQGAKAYQVSNSKKLFQRWQNLLSTHRLNGQEADTEKDRRMRYRVLFLEHCTPTPDQDAGSVSVFNIMLLMREMDFQITFIAEDNYLYDSKYTTKLQKSGIEVLYRPYTTSVSEHLKEHGNRYNLIFLFRPKVVERNIEAINEYCPQAKTLFYTHDIHHIRMEREATLVKSEAKKREADDMKQREFDAIRAVDSTIVVSTTEMDILQPQLSNIRLELLPLLLNIPRTTVDFEKRSGIVFVGGYQHSPNVDAVEYFVSEIFPLVRKLLPRVIFYVVGSKPPQSILNLACDDIVIKGFLEELNPFLDTMRIAVAPLRYGAGVKGKVGTALACGLPMVASPIATEGMGIIHGEQALVGNNPDEFAHFIAKLYNDKDLWNRLSLQGIHFSDESFGPLASYNALRDIITRLGFNIPTQPKYSLSLYDATIN